MRAATAADSELVEILTRDAPLRAPRSLLFATWSDAQRCCQDVGGQAVVTCFRAYPSFPVEAALTARLRGENALFWMLLRRLDGAHHALHAADAPSPAVDADGYTARLREYGSLAVTTLFLLAACHRFRLTWNAGIVVEKLTSQLSLRTLPLLFDATARFRHDSGESTLRLLAACHDMFAREAWRYDADTQAQLEAADRVFAERATAAPVVAAASPATSGRPAPVAPPVAAAAGGERELEARLRSVEREMEAQRQRHTAAFAEALERRLAETEDTLALAHNKVSALEAGISASRALAVPTAVSEEAQPHQNLTAAPPAAIPDAGAKVYAAAMAAAKEELTRYCAEMRAALQKTRTLEELTREVNSVFELAAEREAGCRARFELQLQTLVAESMERAREVAVVRQRLARALECVEEA